MNCGDLDTEAMDVLANIVNLVMRGDLNEEEMVNEVLKYVAKLEYCNHVNIKTLDDTAKLNIYKFNLSVLNIEFKLLNVQIPMIDFDKSPEELEKEGLEIIDNAYQSGSNIDEVVRGLAYLYYADMKYIQRLENVLRQPTTSGGEDSGNQEGETRPQ